MQPVFNEPTDVTFNNRLNRSQSCPNLTIYSCKSPIARRKRALSESFHSDDRSEQPLDLRPLPGYSRHSETNLLYIDKEKTFNPQNALDNTGNILAQVVMALNTFNNSNDKSDTINGGVDLFTDRCILEDEWSILNSAQMETPKIFRNRSKSLYPGHEANILNNDFNAPQFTWTCNNTDIQDYINAQVKKNASKTNKDGNNVVINIDKSKEADEPSTRRKSIFNAFNNVFKRRMTMANVQNSEIALDATESKPKSIISPITERRVSKSNGGRRPQFNLDSIRRQSISSNQSTSSEHILESTTIADLIRAIETAHMKNLLGDVTVDTKTNNFPVNRRVSLIPPAKRRNSVTFNTNTATSTPTSIGPNRFQNLPAQMRRSSLAVPQNRHLTMRQNSSPNRFSVTPVADSPRSAVSLSPIIQRRMRRFSAVPGTVMPRNLNLSGQTTPHNFRRNQFKPSISPLAVSPVQSILKSVREPENE